MGGIGFVSQKLAKPALTDKQAGSSKVSRAAAARRDAAATLPANVR
jgi:hypothetical protein